MIAFVRFRVNGSRHAVLPGAGVSLRIVSVKITGDGFVAVKMRTPRSFPRLETGPAEPETSPGMRVSGRFGGPRPCAYDPKRGRDRAECADKTIRFALLITSVVRFAAHYHVEPSILFRADRRAPQDTIIVRRTRGVVVVYRSGRHTTRWSIYGPPFACAIIQYSTLLIAVVAVVVLVAIVVMVVVVVIELRRTMRDGLLTLVRKRVRRSPEHAMINFENCLRAKV